MAKIVNKEPLVEIVLENIRNDILNEEFKIGERLIVRKLCDKYNVSETPVKHALNRLAIEGLVEAIPRCGMRVKHFTFRDYRQMIEARIVIEKHAVDTAIALLRYEENYYDELSNEFSKNISLMKKYLETKENEDYEIARNSDDRLHEIIVKSTQNPYLIRYHRDLLIHLKMYFMCHHRIKERVSSIIIEHESLFNALSAGNKDKALETLDRHLYQTLQEYSILFEN